MRSDTNSKNKRRRFNDDEKKIIGSQQEKLYIRKILTTPKGKKN